MYIYKNIFISHPYPSTYQLSFSSFCLLTFQGVWPLFSQSLFIVELYSVYYPFRVFKQLFTTPKNGRKRPPFLSSFTLHSGRVFPPFSSPLINPQVFMPVFCSFFAYKVRATDRECILNCLLPYQCSNSLIISILRRRIASFTYKK